LALNEVVIGMCFFLIYLFKDRASLNKLLER